MANELEPRQLDILKAIVEDFIAKGDPVGSQQVSRRGELDVSPATIRAVMADLEELGYLEKPHTSAGRIPTDLGYRLFVDTLLQVREPTSRERLAIDAAVAPEATNLDQALDTASRVVHDLSRHASLVLLPKPDQDTFRRVELIRLREDRVLAVLVSQAGTVQNKLLRLEHAMSQEELTRAANYLNEMLEKLPLEIARERIATELAAHSANYDEHQRRALALAQKMMADPSDDSKMLIAGTGVTAGGLLHQRAAGALGVAPPRREEEHPAGARPGPRRS